MGLNGCNLEDVSSSFFRSFRGTRTQHPRLPQTIGAAMGGRKPGDKQAMFETAFSPFWASWGLGVATARSAVKNQCGGTTRELRGWIMGRFRGRRPFRKLIFGNLVTWLVSPITAPTESAFQVDLNDSAAKLHWATRRVFWDASRAPPGQKIGENRGTGGNSKPSSSGPQCAL